MALTPLAVHEAAEDLLGCVCESLAALTVSVPGHPGCPCRMCVVPGQAAWDACDDPCGAQGGGGQLTVNVVRAYPTPRDTSTTAPSPLRVDGGLRDLRRCGVPDLAVELLITVARCAPMPTEEGCPPSCEELTESALTIHADMLAVQSAVLCCFSATGTERKGRRYVLGETRTVGPQGGCVATETRVTVVLEGCLPCPEEG